MKDETNDAILIRTNKQKIEFLNVEKMIKVNKRKNKIKLSEFLKEERTKKIEW